MTYFIWTNSLNTGVDLIDDDHRQLVGMINALNDAIAEGRGQDVMGKVLDNMILYCRVHFGREEGVMQLTNYPKYQQHKREHEKLLHEIDLLKKDYDKGVTVNSTHMAKMLGDWLRNHIVSVDMQLAAALKANS
jgi:hemerythrin